MTKKKTSLIGYATKPIGILMAAMGVALAYLGATVSCLCTLGPILSLIGLSGVAVGILSLDNRTVTAAGVAVLLTGLYLMLRKR